MKWCYNQFKWLLLFLLCPISVFAGWQVAKPETAIPKEPFFQAGFQEDTSFAASSAHKKPSSIPSPISHQLTRAHSAAAAPYAMSVSGSLKENIERIMNRYHWKVIWKAPYDYNFDGHIVGVSLPNAMEKLLRPFPLQAKLYMSNRTMIIVSRSVDVT